MKHKICYGVCVFFYSVLMDIALCRASSRISFFIQHGEGVLITSRKNGTVVAKMYTGIQRTASFFCLCNV